MVEDDASRGTNAVLLTVRQVEWSHPASTCAGCGQPAKRVWETARTAIDIDLDHPALLQVIVSVHYCPTCRRYFRLQPPFLRPDATYTNRVVTKAVESAYADGMAFTRVAKRLARDFWVRPSERMVRLWCATYTQGLTLAGDYQRWVVSEFSGILRVDEVYQDRLALLLAVDPAAPSGDRLIGYRLVHGRVEQAEVEKFLGRLQEAGIEPEEVITDNAAIYPPVLAAIWPDAAHQLCLFHETRLVTQAVQQVMHALRASLPKPPPGSGPRMPGRPPKPRPGMEPGDRSDRAGWRAKVRALHAQGISIRGIARKLGMGRNTVSRWLREMSAAADEAGPALDETSAATQAPVSVSGGTGPPKARQDAQTSTPGATPSATAARASAPDISPQSTPPPLPWASWDAIRIVAQQLLDARFLILRRPDHPGEADMAQLTELFASPVGEPLRLARDFLEEWYELWRDEAGQRRTWEDARERFAQWRNNEAYATVAPLKRLLQRFDEQRFARLSVFLRDPRWEATNNGAERMGRGFRQRQAPHFNLRSDPAIEGALKAEAVRHQEEARPQVVRSVGESSRGRRRDADRQRLAA